MQGIPQKSGLAPADDGQEKRFHRTDALWKWRRQRSVMTVEAAIAFLPSRNTLISQLFSEVFTNERMRI